MRGRRHEIAEPAPGLDHVTAELAPQPRDNDLDGVQIPVVPRLIEVLGEIRGIYRYAVTDRGRDRAMQVAEVSRYVGPAPVSLDTYTKALERQLKRYMDRLRERRGEGDGAALPQDAAYTIFAAPVGEEEPIPPAPAIIAETKVDIPEASVSDAVMMLDLRNTNALMFRNPRSGQYNMVYRRDDGTIGWVEPSAK